MKDLCFLIILFFSQGINTQGAKIYLEIREQGVLIVGNSCENFNLESIIDQAFQKNPIESLQTIYNRSARNYQPFLFIKDQSMATYLLIIKIISVLMVLLLILYLLMRKSKFK
ncbi:MAG: hypothetical protein K0S23_845 [Fluviicola sp.]|jgi:hypothetical protein|nr:hypothetical protein [Fluviicola sp.]